MLFFDSYLHPLTLDKLAFRTSRTEINEKPLPTPRPSFRIMADEVTMRILITVLSSILLHGFLVSAQASIGIQSLPPQFDAQKWSNLVAAAAQSTDTMDTDSGQFRTLTRITSLEARDCSGWRPRHQPTLFDK